MRQLRGAELKRFNKQVRKRVKPDRELVLVLWGVDYQSNLGIIFRVADAVGAQEIYLTGGSGDPRGREFEKISRYKERVVKWQARKEVETVIRELKETGYQVVGVEIADESVEFNRFEWSKKVALVLGNEGHGLPDKVLQLCDGAVFVPMFGKGGSMNVGVTAAVVGYQVKVGSI